MKKYEKYFVLILFFLIFTIYFLNLPVDYDFDGTVFSQYLRYSIVKNDLTPILQLHHFLYFPLAFITYKLFSLILSMTYLEYFHLQILSLFSSIIALIYLNKIFILFSINTIKRVLFLLFIAFLNLFWLYSVESEVHMLGFMFIVSGIYYLIKSKDNKNLIISSILLGVSTGFHLTNGLIIVSVLLYFKYLRFEFKKYLIFSLSFFSLILIQIFLFFGITGANILDWLKKSLLGIGMTTFHYERFSSISINTFKRFLFSISDSIMDNNSIVLKIIILLILFLILIYSIIRLRKENLKFNIFLLWSLPFTIFFMFWYPDSIEFKLSVLIPIIIYVFLSIKWDLKRLLVLMVIILGLFFNNYSSIKAKADINNNKNYLLCKQIFDNSERNSYVFVAGAGKGNVIETKIYLPYFFNLRVIVLDWELSKSNDLLKLKKKILQYKNASEIYFLSDVLQIKRGLKEVIEFHKIEERKYREFISDFNLKFIKNLIKGYSLFKFE